MFLLNVLPTTDILPYNVKAYQNAYEEEFMASFTPSTLVKGPTDLKKASQLIERLNEGACRVKLSTISFNNKMLKGNVLEGGVCSAIAFRVAKVAHHIFRSLEKNTQLTRESKERVFATSLARYVNELEGIATGGNKLPEKSEQLMIRTEQMALNTITTDRDKLPRGNAVSEKIGAMAPFYGLKVSKSFLELRVKGNEKLQAQLSEQTQSFTKGVYFLRIIQEKYNHKLEEKGHSIVYIKTDEAEYYFDPQLGCYHLFSEAKKTNLIFNALLSANKQFGVDALSFHRLEEENPVTSEAFAIPECNLKGFMYFPQDSKKDIPVVIFSPALGESVNTYKTIAEDLSSKGFCVLCVDHPGSGIEAPKLEEAEIIKLGHQNGSNIEKLVELIRKGYFANICADASIGVLGHSLGGSASIEACRRTSVIKAAINLDGRIIDPTNVSQPLLQVVAKRLGEKEDRKAYNAALSELSKTNPSFCRLEVEASHGDFSSTYFGFQNSMICEYAAFFNKHLLKGEIK